MFAWAYWGYGALFGGCLLERWEWLGRCGWWRGGAVFLFFLHEGVEVDEFVARGYEGSMGVVSVSEAVDGDALLADPGCESGEVAVAGDEAEAGEAAGVEEVHGVDYHCSVGGVLAGGVAELLDRHNGVLEQAFSPTLHERAGPVAVYTPHTGCAVVDHLGHQTADMFRRDVIGID